MAFFKVLTSESTDKIERVTYLHVSTSYEIKFLTNCNRRLTDEYSRQYICNNLPSKKV